ncbi:hypothetical protein ACA910_010927 [Epithemia clementina (nom. ined.)]
MHLFLLVLSWWSLASLFSAAAGATTTSQIQRSLVPKDDKEKDSLRSTTNTNRDHQETRRISSSTSSRVLQQNDAMDDMSLDELVELYQQLGELVTVAQDENGALKIEVADLNQTEQDLEQQLNDEYSLYLQLGQTNQAVTDQHAALNKSASLAEQQVASLNETVTSLMEEYSMWQSKVETLSSDIASTETENSGLNQTVADLRQAVEDGQQVQQDLQDALTEYETTVNWMVASIDSDDPPTLEQVQELASNFANDMIQVNRNLQVFGTLQLQHREVLLIGDCSLSPLFPSQFQNPDTVISETVLTEMLDAINNQWMMGTSNSSTPLCLDIADFQNYLSQTNDLTALTTTKLMEGIHAYASAAMEYLFASEELSSDAANTPGIEDAAPRPFLTPAYWEAAQYDCANIPKFMWPSPS